MTLQEYKNKLKEIESKAEKARDKVLNEYIYSHTDFRVGDMVKLIPLRSEEQHFANWKMEINTIVPYVTCDKRTKKEGIYYIILIAKLPDGTRDFYSWVSTQDDYKLEKV